MVVACRHLFCVVFMKLQLYVSKKNTSRHSEYREEFVFAIVDLDRSASYPENFVCVLPQLRPSVKSSSAFLKIFGDESLPLAKKLLTKALKSEDNSDVKTELQRRVSTLEPKQHGFPCRLCGNTFESKKFGRYKQKVCPNCRTTITRTAS
jgi:hypothetical protein